MRPSEYAAAVSFTYVTCSVDVNIHKHLSCSCVSVQRTLGESDVLSKHSVYGIRNKPIDIGFIVSMRSRYPY